MGQKINPISFRLKVNRSWDSKWFAESNYDTVLHEDLEIKRYVKVIFYSYSLLVSRCFIKRSLNKTNVIVHVYQHTLQTYTQKDLKLVEQVTNIVEKITKGKVLLHIINIKNLSKPKTIYLISKQLTQYKNQKYFNNSLVAVDTALIVKSAPLFAEFLAKQLESHYRHTMFIDFIKKMLPLFLKTYPIIKGVRIQFKGRLNGADRSRKESIQEGQVPLHTLDSNIDFSIARAYTSYGIFGIKVWICF